ncbi:MAG: hypothetical protein HQL22_02805 [Candidatus Omnitrophica bacterium]|nr:hypothetical protein [Candidatus Omnitrophota bacterium]
MALNMDLLENINRQYDKTTARCPACSEKGQDRTGNHLVLFEDGRFACVVFPDSEGIEHRKRIFELVGAKSYPDSDAKNLFSVKSAATSINMEPTILKKDILAYMRQADISSNPGKEGDPMVQEKAP